MPGVTSLTIQLAESEPRLGTANTQTIWQRLKRFMLSRRGRLAQIWLELFVCSIYWPMRDVCTRNYNSGPKFRAGQPPIRVGDTRARQQDDPRQEEEISRDWHWRGWPRLWPWLQCYRRFCSLWMIYVVIKYTFPHQLEATIDFLFHPQLPAHCYLVGRFVMAHGVKRMAAILFASLHLSWRYIQWRHYNPMAMSLVYFLILDDRDIANYYNLVAQPPAHVAPPVAARLPPGSKPRAPASLVAGPEQMLHDVMSYRVDYNLGEVHRLRPNRAAEACLYLRTKLMQMTLACASLYLPLVVVVVAILMFHLTHVSHLLAEHQGCNPELERALKFNATDHRNGGHYFSEHVWVSVPTDLLENWILWSESGNVCFFAPGFTYLLNHDLMISWAHLDRKIEYAHQVVMDSKVRVQGPMLERRRIWLNELVFDLQMQIQDMIRQIEQVNCFLDDDVSSFLIIWFVLFGFFIYKRATDANSQLALVPMLTLLLVASIVTVFCISLLTLHRRMHKSYTLICSLMAHDQSHHKLNFRSVLDYFVQRRTCYTIFRFKRLTTTSFLTILGWTFSFYFLMIKK